MVDIGGRLVSVRGGSGEDSSGCARGMAGQEFKL